MSNSGAGEPKETLLDKMAMAALSVCQPASPDSIAAYTYDIADAMMAEKLRRENGK